MSVDAYNLLDGEPGKESRTFSESFDLFNQEGEKFGESHVTLEPSEFGEGEDKETLHRITKWEIQVSEENRIDMMEYLQPRDPIFISLDGRYYHATPKIINRNGISQARVPKPDNVENIFILLHELGHMKQQDDVGEITFEEEKVIGDKNIPFTYPRLNIVGWNRNFLYVEALIKLRERMIERGLLYRLKDEGIIEKMRELYRLSEAYFDKIGELEGQGKISKDEDIGRHPVLVKMVEEWKVLKNDIGQDKLKEFFGSPTMFLEKDATRRALQWVVDLKKNREIPLYIVKDNNIAGPVTLKNALRTYRDVLEI